MLLKNVSNQIKTVISVLFISYIGTTLSYAKPLQCEQSDFKKNYAKLCRDEFKSIWTELDDMSLTATLVTDAPLRLLDDTHQLWLSYVQQCSSTHCVKQQLERRQEDLNVYTSMNQTLTQHYLKYEAGQLAKQPVHLRIHQLTKDRIKVEGIAYRNPNNGIKSQAIPLLAYTTPNKKNEILDNENDCKYQLSFQTAVLVVNTKQQGCERFKGIYRLYD
ncbi:hypothetical protein G9F32_11425 [Acinetobacter sp. 194]|uniref:A1S_1983 family putative colistin resistance protein n=1 Tax=Acinetobacter shaoyimingii TaxID=2715164 RepID=UPI001409370E|nr:hypothetical protein [Acinetobacter shaoyimingii]NHB58619.1 hypothetical protein [Acinetobacter shaoyimingii]